MRKNVIEEIEGVGTVHFVRSQKAGRVNIRVKPDGEIRVAVPEYASIEDAREFVFSKEKWIKKSLNKIEKKNKDAIISPDEPLTTHFHAFKFQRSKINNLRVNIENGVVEIQFPEELESENEQLQDALRYTYIEVLRKEAKYYLPPRIDELASIHGFKYNDLRIKNIKSRWGSCSGKSNINLSLHIMKLPKNLIDFIILHELCHTVHMNHGPRFHKLLEKVCPGAKQLDKEVKNFGIFKD